MTMDSSKPDNDNLNTVLISLGSNCGSREEAVRKAFEWLSSLLIGYEWSDVYETEPLSGAGRKYMNAVVRGRTSLSCEELERMAKEYERAQGRDEASRLRGDVPVDIDVVAFNDSILRPRDFRASFFTAGLRRL